MYVPSPKSRADGDNHVGFGSQRVGGCRTDDPDRAGMGGVRMRHCPLAGDGFDKRNSTIQREPAVGRKTYRASYAMVVSLGLGLGGH